MTEGAGRHNRGDRRHDRGLPAVPVTFRHFLVAGRTGVPGGGERHLLLGAESPHLLACLCFGSHSLSLKGRRSKVGYSASFRRGVYRTQRVGQDDAAQCVGRHRPHRLISITYRREEPDQSLSAFLFSGNQRSTDTVLRGVRCRLAGTKGRPSIVSLRVGHRTQ